MSRPPAAREAVLDAFERLLIADGERTATLEATANAAGVSKGGLLYHFGSRRALITGLLDRLAALIDTDVARIHDAPEGAVAYFLRSSVAQATPLDRAMVAAVRLAQAGDLEATRALDEARTRWIDAIAEHVPDPSAALAITLVGDGLYYHSALRADAEAAGGGIAGGDLGGITPEEVDGLVALLESVASPPVEPQSPPVE